MKNEVPIWYKEFLTVDEASELFDFSSCIIRGLCYLAKIGRDDFPCVFVNESEKAKIHRRLAMDYFAKAAMEHKRFKIQSLKEIIEETEKPQPRVRRGRPRKVIV